MLGEFKSTIDIKGRLNFPAKFREELGTSFFVSKTIGAQCIKVYSSEGWKKYVEKIKSLPPTQTAKVQRFLFGSAYEVEPDKNGRILLTAPLREYAGLDGELAIVGLEDCAEIWSKTAWDETNAAANSSELLDIAYEFGL